MPQDQHSYLNQEKTRQDYELRSDSLYREHHTIGLKRQKFIKQYAALIMVGLLSFSLLIPALVIPLSVLFTYFVFLSRRLKKEANWALKKPIYEKSHKNYFELASKITSDDGLLYLGKINDGKALWFSKTDLLTHMLILGMTGSGKTELLLSMMYQMALLGSGFIFCDGKADIATWFKLYSMAKRLYLEDNLLVINFLTAGKTNSDSHSKISHTLNPFSHGSADSLMEMVSGFMGSSYGDSMWRGRAEALGRCLLRALCELRDLGEFELSVDVIRANLSLSSLEKLAEHPKLSEFSKSGIKYYLTELPAWKVYQEALKQVDVDEDVVMAAKTKAHEQHGFLTMQYTKTLDALSGTYARITKTDLAEVDFGDVIANRRMLYIMLPSLEKSPESLKEIGRMIVTNIRNALSELLGGTCLTGSKEELLDVKSTNAAAPFAIFLDEYGSYAVEGFGDIGAQSRSINVFNCFSGQEFDSFRKGSDIEASRILSNTGIKIVMKSEGNSNNDIVKNRGGEGYFYVANHIKKNQTSLGNFTKDTGNYSLQKMQRVSQQDLVKLKPGQCFVFFNDYLWKVNSFYANVDLVEKTHINHFIKLRPSKLGHTWSPMAAKTWAEETQDIAHPKHLSHDLLSFISTKQEQVYEYP